MRIVALDFETANASSASACSLGISIYEEGEILDSFEWYFKPFHRYCYFTNSHIHGITMEDVINEEEFVFYYERLEEILKDAVIVAHNAPFDIGVLNAMCDVYGLNHFKNEYIDTVTISRRVYPELYNHKLNTVSKYLGIELDHHNGKSDSFACLMILLKAMEAYNIYDLKGFLEKITINFKKNM
ncbi:MAG: exonuclease domain-containing protein [Erysipelotrichaceae bacterium]|nr:exonuclease domain-containing protein [Erysipelotrichaceae bacterium]